MSEAEQYSSMTGNGLDGLRVVSFESRLSDEMGALIERHGGHVQRAPSMRELPMPESPDATAFADALLNGRLDMVIFMTGVGARTLMSIIEKHHPRQAILDALGSISTVVRGPKPVATMREWGIAPSIKAPEPNTWREVLDAIDSEAGSLQGKRIAVQEYGAPNDRLTAGLRERGAEVMTVAVYAWGLPEDLEPLHNAIRAIVAGEVDVVTFTSAQQIRNVLLVTRELGCEEDFRNALRRTVIGSIGPTASETLCDLGLGFEFEPDRPKMIHLVRGLGRSAGMLLLRKRASHEAGVDTLTMRRVDIVWPQDETGGLPDPLADSAFMRACRRVPAPYTPIWIMRQAGRYQRAYRELRSRVSFLDLCKRSELAAEVTLMAVDQLGVDAAIIFSDILLVVEPMGLGLTFREPGGPHLPDPVRTREQVEALKDYEPAEALSFVGEAIRMTRRALRPSVPLIGFCGAPFTLASYMIEGGGSRNHAETKGLMYRDPGLWHALLERITPILARHLNAQIEAGAQAAQVFDSWVGCLDDADYRAFVLPHTKKLIDSITPGVPIIHFAANNGMLLSSVRDAGGDVIGLDWRVRLDQAWWTLGDAVAVQGNLDPTVLLASPSEIRRRAHVILDQAGGRPGHIFNLGHGILPTTPVENAIALVDAVHEYQTRR